MKTKLVSLIAITAVILATPGWAQGWNWRGGCGWGAGSPYSRMYDAKTVETLRGEVVTVERLTPMRGMGGGVHLQLKTEKETISVHLGPIWFIENQDVEIKARDEIVVKGSRITFENKPAIIAAEIKKGDGVLKLRDENGVPMWAGWRRGRAPTP